MKVCVSVEGKDIFCVCKGEPCKDAFVLLNIMHDLEKTKEFILLYPAGVLKGLK